MEDNNNNTCRQGMPQDSRLIIVKRIMDTLQRHLPSGQERSGALLELAQRYEEGIFQTATDQQDYLRKISLRMLSLETKAQASPATAIQARLGNPGGVMFYQGATMLMQNPAQISINGVQLPGAVSGQTQQRQQMLAQSFQNNLNANVMHSSTGLGSSFSSMTGMPQVALSGSSGKDTMLNVNAQRMAMQREHQQYQQQHQQQPQQQQAPQQQTLAQQPLYLQRLQHQQEQFFRQKLQQQALLQEQQQQQPLHQQGPPLQQQQPQFSNQLMSQTPTVPSALQQQQQQQAQQQQPTALQSQSQQSQQPSSTQQLGQQPQQIQILQFANQQAQQQRLQQPGVLNQQQRIIYDTQQHQKRRALPESSSASVDSLGHSAAVGMDHREVVWPKLQVLKEKYLQDMKELYGMLTQRRTMPMPPEQLQKLQHYKDVLQRTISYLTVPKERVPREFNPDNVESFEKGIVNILETLRRRRQTPPQQLVLTPQHLLQPNQVPQPSQQHTQQQHQVQQHHQQLLSKIQEQDNNCLGGVAHVLLKSLNLGPCHGQGAFADVMNRDNCMRGILNITLTEEY